VSLAVQHDRKEVSVMTDPANPSVIVRIPTPIWLLTMIGAALVVGDLLDLAAIVQHRPAGIAVFLAGFLWGGWAILTFRRHRAEILPSSTVHSVFVRNGPFRWSRNPMYLGSIVMGIGAALLDGTWLMWLVPVVLFLLQNFVIIPFEERSMRQTFGAEYEAYCARVRRWI
jgi:protein-S-isoprenylcysteine O-methyltransferase Ste14